MECKQYGEEPKQEKELAEKARAGDKNALDTLIIKNMRLVYAIANEYKGYPIPTEDIVQNGMVGLVISAQRFDPDRNIKFSTYADYRIRREIKLALIHDYGTIGFTGNALQVYFKLKRYLDTKELKGEPVPPADAIAKELNVSLEVLNHVMIHKEPLSLDAPVDDEGDTLAEFAGDGYNLEDDVSVKADEEILKKILKKKLTGREYDVVISHYGFDGEPSSFEEIAKRYGLTKQRINQIDKSARQKLTKCLRKWAGNKL